LFGGVRKSATGRTGLHTKGRKNYGGEVVRKNARWGGRNCPHMREQRKDKELSLRRDAVALGTRWVGRRRRNAEVPQVKECGETEELDFLRKLIGWKK